MTGIFGDRVLLVREIGVMPRQEEVVVWVAVELGYAERSKNQMILLIPENGH